MAKRSQASRVDPYKNFKFRLKWDGRYVAGVREVTVKGGPKRAAKSKRKLVGLRKFTSITLKRGYTTDRKFAAWVDSPQRAGSGKRIVVEQRNEAGTVVALFGIDAGLPAKFQGVANLDGSGNEVTIEMLVLQSEGLGTAADRKR